MAKGKVRKGVIETRSTEVKSEIEAQEIYAFDNKLRGRGQYEGAAEYLAVVKRGADRDIVKIHRVTTGEMIKEWQFERSKKNGVNCVRWGEVENTENENKAGNRKKRRRGETENGDGADESEKKIELRLRDIGGVSKVLAVGKRNGDIEIYSVQHGNIVGILKGGHSEEVKDVEFVKTGLGEYRLYSVDRKGLILEWDVVEEKVVAEIKTGVKNVEKLSVSLDHDKIVLGGEKLTVIDIPSQTRVGDSVSCGQEKIKEMSFFAGKGLVTLAEKDNSINLWEVGMSIADDQEVRHKKVHVFEERIKNVAVGGNSKTSLIAVLLENGQVKYWKQGDEDEATDKEVGQEEMKSIHLVDNQGNSGNIKFVEIISGDQVKIGKQVGKDKVEFELVKAFSDEGSTTIVKDNSKGKAQGNNSIALTSKYSEKKADVYSSLDNSTSLENRLKSLQLQSTQLNGKQQTAIQKLNKNKEAQRHNAGSLLRVLVQSISTNDKELLETVLKYSYNPQLVNQTVYMLPSQEFVVPFLNLLVERYQRNPNRSAVLVPWIKSVLVLHASYLATLPYLVDLFSSLYFLISSRVTNQQQSLIKLNSRLEFFRFQSQAKKGFSMFAESGDKKSKKSSRSDEFKVISENGVDQGLSAVSGSESEADSDFGSGSERGSDSEYDSNSDSASDSNASQSENSESDSENENSDSSDDGDEPHGNTMDVDSDLESQEDEDEDEEL
ncbi:WD repeat-containing protein 43 [Zancudomyces culisetae]|uniref:WD repeat-containing protein 43 n=1 Tax=Zancudomyces culisetae TaxID=1213189 RepID=A0A1R1PX17_ZANCU|nr:WD repeat-containing protein 43 [Zancudomyces culisetae]|eukprot:OMH85530.1 WD repeat-containing protein 43 [Zancudomyces culisetae]